MRIRSLKINQWRHFENLELNLEDDCALVCVVGGNGSGKSHLLELIAASAHKLGLSPGIEIPRGSPFADPHNISMKFYLAPGISASIDEGLTQIEGFHQWDRTITLESRGPENPIDILLAGGIADHAVQHNFAHTVVAQLRATKEVHFLSLDADRAYPKKNLNIHEVAQAYEIDWAGEEYTRGRSFRTTSILYDEWLRFFLAQENQAGTKLIQANRKASKLGAAPPLFFDHFKEYSSALQQVLPHISFTGVDSKTRALLFESAGLPLNFDQLSGGEREISFLVGQIDRFGLRQGLLLIDEPELHLNADLIRTWVAYLTGTVDNGQIWLATHSLEAVEAAGQSATFILDRNPVTRKVDSITRLDKRPIFAALSRSVGTPAFSISQLRFVYVEGEDGIGERERFQKLAGSARDIRFMEGGASSEVTRRVNIIKSLAAAEETGIRIGGIIDRDYKGQDVAEEFAQQKGMHVLEVHEAENFHLHPATLQVVLNQNNQDAESAAGLIRRSADERAGNWIFQSAMTIKIGGVVPAISVAAKEAAKRLTWSDYETNFDDAIEPALSKTGFDSSENAKFKLKLKSASSKYAQHRADDAVLWKTCEGKQVLPEVARFAGFASANALVLATFAAWARDESLVPAELVSMRKYLDHL